MEFKGPQRKDLPKIYRVSWYNRLERSIGWFLFYVGILILLIYGGLKIVNCFVKDVSIPLLLKIGILGIIGGLVILLVSLIKEQLFIRKSERHKDIES
jgi:hypothetical protein